MYVYIMCVCARARACMCVCECVCVYTYDIIRTCTHTYIKVLELESEVRTLKDALSEAASSRAKLATENEKVEIMHVSLMYEYCLACMSHVSYA
jgi:hypothetical protein